MSLSRFVVSAFRRYRSKGVCASYALHAARVWDAFTDLEHDGVARFICEEDECHRDPDFGPWVARTEVLIGKRWRVADSLGGLEESQLHDVDVRVDLMQAAVDAYAAYERDGESCRCCDRPVGPETSRGVCDECLRSIAEDRAEAEAQDDRCGANGGDL